MGSTFTPDLRNAWSVHVGHPIVRSQCDCSASCVSCDLDLAFRGPLSAKPRQDSASGKLPYHWLSPNLITHKPVIKLTPSDVGEHQRCWRCWPSSSSSKCSPPASSAELRSSATINWKDSTPMRPTWTSASLQLRRGALCKGGCVRGSFWMVAWVFPSDCSRLLQVLHSFRVSVQVAFRLHGCLRCTCQAFSTVVCRLQIHGLRLIMATHCIGVSADWSFDGRLMVNWWLLDGFLVVKQRLIDG